MSSGADRSARELEDSTLASSAPACASSFSARRTPTDVASLAATGVECRASRTYLAFDWSEDDSPAPDRDWTPAVSPWLAVLTSSAEVHRAKTSASLADDEVSSTESAPACSSSSPESPMTLFATEDGCCLRTFPDFFPALADLEADETSRSYSRRWPTSGFTTSPGECWTATTSECPSAGDASTSLQDVLLETVPDRFYLSPRAAAGILRRAEKRARALPRPLHRALTELASAHPADDSTTTRTSSPTPSIDRQEEPTTTAPKPTTLSPEPSSSATGRALTQTPRTRSSLPTPSRLSEDAEAEGSATRRRLSLIPSDQRASMPARTAPDAARLSSQELFALTRDPAQTTREGSSSAHLSAAQVEADHKLSAQDITPTTSSSVRRITPTECERLQAFPDGWTIPTGPSLIPDPTDPATQPAVTP